MYLNQITCDDGNCIHFVEDHVHGTSSSACGIARNLTLWSYRININALHFMYATVGPLLTATLRLYISVNDGV